MKEFANTAWALTDSAACALESWGIEALGGGPGEALEALGSFFDVIFDQVTTHLKLRISSIEKKRSQERIWRGLERFGKDFGELLGEVGSLSGRHLGSIWCISSWKSVPLILMFYGTDSQL